MTKALQERIFSRANLYIKNTRFVLVRYGNVLASRGSVIPLFHEQIKSGGPVTITHQDMTRFLLSLNEAVDLIFKALASANPGETYIPQGALGPHDRRGRRPDRRPAHRDGGDRHPPRRKAA